MSYQHFHNSRQQFRDFRRAPEEQQQQSRNGMKRPRGYSPPAFDCASASDSSSDNSSHQVTKRLRTLSCSDGMTSRNFNNSNITNTNTHTGGLFFTSKSDDEISLAEDAQTTPTVLPHHSSFMQHKQNHHYYQQHTTQIHQQQQQLQLQQSHMGNHQAVSSSVSATNNNVHSGNIGSRAGGTTYATDYQPMNSLLGNLHLIRQQQQQQRRRQQTSVGQAQALQQQARIPRDHSAMVPQQQQPQYQYHQHHNRSLYGNHPSVPTTAANAVASSGTNRSRRKTVSLRVNSNLY